MKTIYEINQDIANELPPLTDSEKYNSKSLLKQYLSTRADEKFFTLLNYEKRYFTIFHNINSSTEEEITEQIFGIIDELGILKTVQYADPQGTAIEFWIDNNMYLFFPYTKGVVEV